MLQHKLHVVHYSVVLLRLLCRIMVVDNWIVYRLLCVWICIGYNVLFSNDRLRVLHRLSKVWEVCVMCISMVVFVWVLISSEH
jgi:hypothetical protein